MSAEFLSPISLVLEGFNTKARRVRKSPAATTTQDAADTPPARRNTKISPLVMAAIAVPGAIAASLIPTATPEVVIPKESHKPHAETPNNDSVHHEEIGHTHNDSECNAPQDDDWMFEHGHPDELDNPPPDYGD